MDKKSANKRYKEHDENSIFLGYSKIESDKWINYMKQR